MLALKFRPRAQIDRESIAIYIGFECGMPQAARDVIGKIDAATHRVREFPDSGGRFYDASLANAEYRTVKAGKYTVFYRYDSQAITVYRILHHRQDIDSYSFVNL